MGERNMQARGGRAVRGGASVGVEVGLPSIAIIARSSRLSSSYLLSRSSSFSL